MDSSRLLQLMQLADSALPVGGFAFSGGLEWMVKSLCLTDEESFLGYLGGIIHQAGSFDLPFLNSFISELESRESLQEYNLLLYTPSVYKASITQGRAWNRLLPQLGGTVQLQQLRENLREWGLPPHFLYVLSTSLTGLGYSRDSIATLFCFMLVRDQISSAIRLGVIGPGQAQGLLTRSLQGVDQVVEESEGLNHSDAWRTSVMIDIAQGAHEGLYTKLFQN